MSNMDKKWLEKLFHEKSNLRPTDKAQHVINVILDKYNQQNRVIQEEVKYSIKIETRTKQLEGELKELREKWFKKGQNSIKRKNKSGCCCIINDDDEIESMCKLHGNQIKQLEDGVEEMLKILTTDKNITCTGYFNVAMVVSQLVKIAKKLLEGKECMRSKNL